LLPGQLSEYRKLFAEYTELRYQENRERDIHLLNGDVSVNADKTKGGISARVYTNGVWGFAAVTGSQDDMVKEAIRSATENAHFLDARANRNIMPLPAVSGESYHDFSTKQQHRNRKEKIGFLKELDSYIQKTCKNILSRSMALKTLDMKKSFINSDGSSAYSMVPRSLLILSMTSISGDSPTDLFEIFGGFGQYEDNFGIPDDFFERIDLFYESLRKKAEGVYPETGEHDVILDSEITGVFAHEAIGHTTEADIVSGGGMTYSYMGKRIGSEKLNLSDFANTAMGRQCPVPVFVDDEGTPAVDVALVKDGILCGMMHNKESAMKYDVPPTGNARASEYDDEPLIRMRNTGFLPGQDKLEDMIASIDKGYYLMRSSNGQADSTSEFMFGVIKGYEIVKGKLGRAIKDTTISGMGFDMLGSVSMVSDEMSWSSWGMCGKKQAIPVGFGGPSIKCRVNIGGR